MGRLGLITINVVVLLFLTAGCFNGEGESDNTEGDVVERSELTGVARDLTRLIHGDQDFSEMEERFNEINEGGFVAEDVVSEWFDFSSYDVQRKYSLGMKNEKYSEEHVFFEERDELGDLVYIVGVLSEIHKVPDDEPHHDFMYDTFDMFYFNDRGELIDYSRHW